MGITIKGNLFYIQSKEMSMIIENREGDLLLRHIGGKIVNYHGSNAIFEKDHAFSGNPTPDNRTFSYDTQRQIFGVHGFGDFRCPSFKIQHDNNELTQFKLKDSHILHGVVETTGLPSPHSMEDAETLELVLEDGFARLRLTLYYTAYANRATISTFAKISNLSDKAVVINRALSTMLDVPAGNYDVVTLQGAYAREKTVRRQKVEQGIFSIASNRGASGHAQTPAVILCDRTATEDAGSALALQLLYSGNFQAFVQKNQLNEVRLGLGINDDNFAWQLAAGDSFETPVALMTYSAKGLTHLSQESQLFIQDHIMPKQFAHAERPILINNWEATYFDFKKEKLLDLADEASKLGIELFVLDDGWFGNRFDDNRGLWFEPEMISVDSDLYRAHPDWAIQVEGRGHTYSRNQLVLNLANPDVVAYIKAAIDKILTENAIDYVKWDYNRNITNIGNGDSALATKMQSHAYVLGLYDLVSYLTGKHSNILFESCSGGGGRNDLGMMRYFPQVWASDNTDAISRLQIQYGSSYLYPTISMGSHVSASPNHQMGRTTPIETRGNVAMMGNIGYELDLTSLPESDKEVIAAQVAHYKDIRSVVQFGKQYRLINPEQGSNEAAVEFVHEDKVVVTYVRTLSTIETIETTLKLKALEEVDTYRLQETGQVFSGAELMYAGLTVTLPQGDYLSKQYYFVKQ
ncbi:MAG: alpha-galactosidase [Streptococcus gallolyticus]|uniref:Alpha-galactosidase n=1 Tax=Streptococcus gallolyticus TaxID=315405 RepID=A0A927XJV5_9STRE|nr:alpha-galactosidase [Streptococcus gallolyticus]